MVIQNRKACCYGLDYLEGDESGGSCDATHARFNRGFKICDADFLSDTHKVYLKIAYVFITISACLQLANIMTIEWGVANYIGAIQKEEERRKNLKREGKSIAANCTEKQLQILPIFRKNPSDSEETYISLSLIMRRLG